MPSLTQPDPRKGDTRADERPLVIQTEHLAEEAANWLAQRCKLEHVSSDDPRFESLLTQAVGLVVRTYTRVDQAMLSRAPKLKVVGRAGAGVDNIDVAACRSRGIEVVYAPDANTQAVVEYVISLVLEEFRPRVEVAQAMNVERWKAIRAATPGRQLNECTVGLLGLGRIGKRLARVLGAIGSRVLYNDLLEIPVAERHGAIPVGVEELFQQCDVVSIHIDGRPGNRGFVSGRLLGLMKPGVMFVNAARGMLIDTQALAGFLRANPNARAMLDVHDPEPFGRDYPLLGLANARLYPHLAARTEAAMTSMSWVVRDIVAVIEGRRPEFSAPRESAGG